MGRKSKFTDSAWRQIKVRVANGESMNSIAKEYGINESSIRRKLGSMDVDQEELKGSDQSRQSGYIYLISMTDSAGKRYCKIGLTNEVQKRMAILQCSSPFQLNLHCSYYVPDSYAEESLLHEFFKSKRLKGEWFDLTDEDVGIIASRCLRV